MLDALPALFAHLVEPFVDPASRTFWPGLLVAAVVAAGLAGWSVRREPGRAVRRAVRAAVPLRLLRSRSSMLDVQLLAARQLLTVLGVVPTVLSAWWLAYRVVGVLDATVGAPPTWSGSVVVPSTIFAITLFIAWDLSRYLVHRLMHAVPFLWAFHQVHHSAEVLTPLTFHRVHPVESVIYALRGAVVTGLITGVFFWTFRGAASDLTLLGVNAVGLVGNALTGNLRHSHVWLRFGPAVERWLLSPAQHQLHHARDPALHGHNYGTWIALWDRLGGTLAVAPERAPTRYGVSDRNHGDNLVSAWFGPVLSVGRGLRPGVAVISALAVSVVARAAPIDEDAASDRQDPLEEPEGDAIGDAVGDERPNEAIVVSDRGVPRVVGSAHVVDQEELTRFEQTDIHQVLSVVPGVYVRTEEGYGLRPNIGLRGANSDRSSKVTLLEDGVLFAPAPYAAPAAYYFPMTSRLYGVEVFKGPAATQHGPQTVGGAVNLLTRPVPQDGPVAALDLGFGQRRTSRVHAYAGGGDERRGVLIEGSLLDTAGFRELDTGGPTGFLRGDLMVKGRLATDPDQGVHHTFGIKLGYGGEESNETYLGLHGDDFDRTPTRRYAASALDRMRWDRTQAELSWTARIGDDLDVHTVAYHHYLQRSWLRVNRFAGGPDLHGLLSGPASGQSAVYLDILRGREDAITEDQLLLLADNDRQFHSGGVQSRLRWRTQHGQVRSQLEAGLRFHADHVRRYHTESTYRMTGGALRDEERPLLVPTDSVATVFAVAAHLHETLDIGRVTLVPGVRVEAMQSRLDEPDKDAEPGLLRAALLPGFGAMARVGQRAYLFAGIHRGFTPVAPGQPAEISPESSWNTEAGVRVGQAFGPRLEAVGFVNDYANLTGQCTFSGGCLGDDLDRQFNGGKALIYGAEAVLGSRWNLPARLALGVDGTYTLTQSRFQTGFVSGFSQFGTVERGDFLPYVPQHQGALTLTVDHPRFSVSSRAVGRSSMLDAAGTFPIDPARDIPALLTVDASVHVRLSEAVRLWGTGTNLGNAQPVVARRPFGARSILPRQLMVGVELSTGREPSPDSAI